MSFNGSGTFNINSSGQPVSASTLIEAAVFNAFTADVGTGLSTAITKDGQTTVTANLPMATFRHTGVGNGSARTDYAALGQVQDGTPNWVDGGGTADAITATYSPVITALVDGQICFVRATAANATTTPTFSPNGLTARTIVKRGGTALVAGEIAGDNHELILRYRSAATQWELMNPAVTPTTLGLVIGTNVQAYDAQLSAQIRQNSQSAAYTTVLADGGKHIYHPTTDNNARTFTIDSNANVAYPIGTAITFINEINTVTIAITSDTLVMIGTGSTGSRTLAANGMATAIKVTSTRWVISGTLLS